MIPSLEKVFEEASQLPETEQIHLANEFSKLISFASCESLEKEGEPLFLYGSDGLIEEEVTCLGTFIVSDEDPRLVGIELLDGPTFHKRVKKEVGINLQKWNNQWVDATGIAKRKPESMEIKEFELVRVALNPRGEELVNDYWASKDNQNKYEILEEEDADKFIQSL